MSRRALLQRTVGFGTSLAGLAAVSSACTMLPSRAPARVPRIGYLVAGPREGNVKVDAFLGRLRDLGYVEGQTIAIEWRSSLEGGDTAFPALAADLVQHSVDVIVVDGGSAAAQAAKQATSTIPIVMTSAAADPAATGLVESDAHPGGNLTGIGSTARGLYGKWVELLLEVVPGVARPVALVYPDNPAVIAIWEEVQAAAGVAGLDVQRVDVRSSEEVEVAFGAAASRGADAVIIAAILLLLPVRERVAALALQHRLPGIGGTRDYVEAGLLMDYAATAEWLVEARRRAAVYVDRILKGAKPGDLPIEQPTEFELAVNVRTLQALGLSIPPSVLPLVTAWIQ